MSSTFDGLRLDNLHNTPLHVAKYMLQKARSANPNLYIMGELFCNSKESECKYVQELGINALIREIQHTNNTDELAGYIYHNNGCKTNLLGKLDDTYKDYEHKLFKYLKQSDIEPLVYDCTHDNPSPIDRFLKEPSVTLAHVVAEGMAGVSIGSTFGYDIMVPKQLSVVSEKRPYPFIDFKEQIDQIIDLSLAHTVDGSEQEEDDSEKGL